MKCNLKKYWNLCEIRKILIEIDLLLTLIFLFDNKSLTISTLPNDTAVYNGALLMI